MATSKRKAHCNKCGGETNHLVLHTDSTRWANDEASITGGTEYEMLKCAGCDKIVLREREWCSEDDPHSEPNVKFFPPTTFRPEPKWLTDFYLEFPPGQDVLHDILKEIYVALQNAQPYLAAMGIRALLEQVMIEKVGDNKTFGENLKRFEEAGHVSSRQREQLATILDVGSAAIHRGYKPSEDDLTTMIELTEVLIQSIYLHQGKVKDLKGKIPPRKR